MSEKPIYILPENIQRELGKDAQRNNIMAAKIVADTVKSTLGPKGMDKMLVDSGGEIIVTNDGVTILEEMQIEHPAARMMVEIARTQEQEVGDGTTTAVMFAGKLLENAEELLDKKIHPTIIIKGYRLAKKESLRILNEISKDISSENIQELRNIAETAMTGKGAESVKEKYSEIIVNAIKQVANNDEVDLDNIKIEKGKGDSLEDTELISGIVLDQDRANKEMPQKIENAKILLLSSAIEIKQLDNQSNISVSSPEQLQGFIQEEEKIIKQMVDKIKESGAGVVFCQKGIDDLAQYYLSKAGIYACRRVPRTDLEKIAKATTGKIVNNVNDLSQEDFGYADRVEERKNNEEEMTYITGCRNPKALTILLKGGSEHVLDEIERAIRDGLGDVSAALKYKKIVAGGGAIEIELARRLRQFSSSLQGREQLAVEKFASALEFIPSTLAENAGLDPIDILTELKSRHESGEPESGINLFNARVENTLQSGIIEPLKIKTQAINSAFEVSSMILRIDDVIAAGKGSAKRLPQMSEFD